MSRIERRGQPPPGRREPIVDLDPTPWSGTFDDLEAADRLAVVELVLAGGAVVGGITQLTKRLRNAHLLGLLREPSGGRIVGAAALKRPDSDYRKKVFDHAGVAIAVHENAAELGYVVVAFDKRGNQLSGRLVDLIARKTCQAAFATTDNRTMQNNLLRSGFTRAGNEWDGQKGALSLWLLAPR